MAVNIHITIIELNALHTKRQNLFQELDAVIHLLMEDRKSGSAGMPRPTSYAVFCLKKKSACWMGGLTVARMAGEAEAHVARIQPKGKWSLLLAVLAQALSTEEFFC